jgi:hypothetical protein
MVRTPAIKCEFEAETWGPHTGCVVGANYSTHSAAPGRCISATTSRLILGHFHQEGSNHPLSPCGDRIPLLHQLGRNRRKAVHPLRGC